MRTKVLVTGANGQLGKTIKDLYSQNPEGLDITFTSRQELNISNKNEIEQYLKNNNFQYCINCAAFTNVEQAEKTPEMAFKINAEAVLKLAKTCEKTETILIHISTDYVFDGKKNSPYTEEDIANPINQYGKSKLLGEQHIQNSLKKYFVIRASWLYSEYGNNFMNTMLKLGMEKSQIRVVSDQYGSPTYGKDLAMVIIKFIESGTSEFGIYHYSNEGVANWYDFAKAIFDLRDQSIKVIPISTDEYPTFAKRPKFSALDTTKIKRTFGIQIPQWKDSLKTAISKCNE